MTRDHPAIVVQEYGSASLVLPQVASALPTADSANVETDDLAPARGIVGGCLVGLILWISLGLAAALLLHP